MKLVRGLMQMALKPSRHRPIKLNQFKHGCVLIGLV